MPSLIALLESEHEVVGVVTRPPAPKGRSKKLVPSPVEETARAAGVPVLTPRRIADSAAQIVSLDPDAAAVVAYGGLIPPALLDLFPWVNLHFSLLPRWRGAAPVQRAIEAGDRETGAVAFLLEEGLDTGPILAELRRPLDGTETSESLLAELSMSGVPLLISALDALADGSAAPRAQRGDATLAPRLLPADGRIDWRNPAERISRHTRAFWPSPGAWTELGGERVKIGPIVDFSSGTSESARSGPGTVAVREGTVRVSTGEGDVVLDRIAPPGKQWMNAADWFRGLRSEAVFQ